MSEYSKAIISFEIYQYCTWPGCVFDHIQAKQHVKTEIRATKRNWTGWQSSCVASLWQLVGEEDPSSLLVADSTFFPTNDLVIHKGRDKESIYSMYNKLHIDLIGNDALNLLGG